MDRLRSAWAVVAGRGTLSASLDVDTRGPGLPRLWARLTNPTSDTFPLNGWAFVLRIEPAMEGPVTGFSPCLGTSLSSHAQGATWALRDLGAGESFEADINLPSGSLFPLTARLALYYPFTVPHLKEGEAMQHQHSLSPGLCLELGSRPLDILDLSRPAKNVPLTPSAIR